MIREKFHFSHRGTSLLRSNLVVKKWGGAGRESDRKFQKTQMKKMLKKEKKNKKNEDRK